MRVLTVAGIFSVAKTLLPDDDDNDGEHDVIYGLTPAS
jgi:hypothetical protein